ncbi:hypothetical protein BIV59_18210 [Bacillus sp. MUM 13]|nr:hypothetical protein BIV59_18210 [Bacillus sp. MUM 13]
MNKKYRNLIALLGCIILFIFGTYRILTESLTSTSLVAAYIFAAAGFIGFIGNLLIMKRNS